MRIEVLDDAAAVARAAARFIADEARTAVAARGRFVLAVSGGKTPWEMLRALLGEDVPWDRLKIVQVDERQAPAGHPDRNLTRLQGILLGAPSLQPEQIHAMPVVEADQTTSALSYARTLAALSGTPPVLDLIHLGLGSDGHTASLVPGDPVLDVTDRDVAWSGVYQGRSRMTLTYPVFNRSRRILWVVAGPDKTAMLCRLRDRDKTIPAGRVRQDLAVVIADRAAAGTSPT